MGSEFVATCTGGSPERTARSATVQQKPEGLETDVKSKIYSMTFTVTQQSNRVAHWSSF